MCKPKRRKGEAGENGVMKGLTIWRTNNMTIRSRITKRTKRRNTNGKDEKRE
jgi:hypothetical protein